MDKLIKELREKRILPREMFHELLSTNKYDALLIQSADEIRQSVYGKDVYIRGLIEFTNYCRNDCHLPSGNAPLYLQQFR